MLCSIPFNLNFAYISIGLALLGVVISSVSPNARLMCLLRALKSKPDARPHLIYHTRRMRVCKT